ncbi:MAG TPA: zinc ABC transporter substrate-binding protein [Patescibacteria group bacterium]|jgi:zinc transport system substrate-binding protein|nr:zinc ABC transporter substrate-binding protein [Patescibacteria group bacterium]
MNKKLIVLLGILVLIFAAVLLFNFGSTRKVSNGKLQVTASFYPMYFFASRIGGDKADVISITPASAEPHDYEPTTQDLIRIQNSNMLVLNGGALEAWGNKIKGQLPANVLVVTAGEGLANKQLNENGQTIQDPHIWLDPILAKKEVVVIEKGFEKIDSKDTSYFQANAQKLNSDLDALNTEYSHAFTNCAQTDFVTSHAAFGYLGRQYGINQIPISGVSPDEEPSTQKLVEITNLVKAKNIKVIFFESLVSPKLSDTIANETGAKAMVLDPIEGLTKDEIANGQNYLTIMRQNLNNLQIALQCQK